MGGKGGGLVAARDAGPEPHLVHPRATVFPAMRSPARWRTAVIWGLPYRPAASAYPVRLRASRSWRRRAAARGGPGGPSVIPASRDLESLALCVTEKA